MEDIRQAKLFTHTSVLLNETVEGLAVKPDGIYVDGTLGGGGHAEKVLSLLGPDGRLIGIDQDEAAVLAAAVVRQAALLIGLFLVLAAVVLFP